MCSTVRVGADDVVELEIDQRGLAARCCVRGLVSSLRVRVVHGEPLAIRKGGPSATEEALLVGRARVDRAGYRYPQTGECIEVREVLLAGVVEVDVGVAAAWPRSLNSDDRVRRFRLSHDPERLPSVDRTEPGAPLRPRSSRPAYKDPALRVDGDIGLTIGMNRVDHARDPKRDRS